MAANGREIAMYCSPVRPGHRLHPFKGDVETAERDTVAGSGRDQRLSGVCRIGRHTQNGDRDAEVRRSEEHTSELQSLMRISYAVFCLKKKKQYIHTTNNSQIQQQ